MRAVCAFRMRDVYSMMLSATPEFFLMGIHVRPADVIQELEALVPAFQQTSEFYGSSRGTILGDLNAGCRLAHTLLLSLPPSLSLLPFLFLSLFPFSFEACSLCYHLQLLIL